MSCPSHVEPIGPAVLAQEALRLEQLRAEFATRVLGPLLRHWAREAGLPESAIGEATVSYNYAAAVTDLYEYGGRRE